MTKVNSSDRTRKTLSPCPVDDIGEDYEICKLPSIIKEEIWIHQ
jgi:hypothetical protein